jgi:hypothetical protein
MPAPIVVDFPLRGEWICPNTPGTKVPSHGTDMLAETYAYDFVGIESRFSGRRFYRPSPIRYLVLGVQLQDCYGWGRPIYSSTDGIVVRAEDGWPERNPVHIARDLTTMLKNARTFNKNRTNDLCKFSGNFVLIESNEGYVLYAHAQTGSIKVHPGDKIVSGQELAKVGHSGNSTAPHLHFQLMDHEDPWKAKGILCCFREYEVFHEGAWRRVQNGIPKVTDIIRIV